MVVTLNGHFVSNNFSCLYKKKIINEPINGLISKYESCGTNATSSIQLHLFAVMDLINNISLFANYLYNNIITKC